MPELKTKDLSSNPLVVEIAQWAANSHVAILVINAKGKVLFTNEICEKELEIKQDEVVVWSQDREKVPEGYIEITSLDKQNPIVHVASVLNLDYYGERAYLLIVEENSTNQKIPVPEIPENMETIMGVLPGIAYRRANDDQWSMEFLSDRCFELTGYTVDCLLGNSEIAYANLIDSDDLVRINQEVKSALDENRPFQLLYKINRQDGNCRWVQDQGRGIFDEQDQVGSLEGWIIDITDRKDVEEALTRSENLYRSLVEASPDAVLLVDMQGTILLANQQLARMLEIENLADLVGRSIIDFLASQTRELSIKSFEKKLSGNKTSRGKYTGQTRTGRTFPVDVNMRAIYGVDGQPYSYIGVIRDISEQEQTLHALRTSAAYYRAIVEDTPEMIVRFLHDGTVTFANLAYANFYGIDRNELMGANLLEILPESSRGTIQKILSFVLPDMKPAIKEHTVKKNGDTRWFRWKTSAIRDDAGIFLEYQSVGEDISDEKKAESVRNQSEQMLKDLMENITLVALILDLKGNINFCNSHYLNLTGFRRENVIGKNWMEGFVPFDVAVNLRKMLLESALSGKISQRIDNMILTSKGEQRLIAWNNTLIRNQQGVISAIASIGEDITERYFTERTQEAIYKISQSAIDAEDLDGLYYSIHQILKDLMPADNFFIALFDETPGLLSFPYFVDQFDEQPAPQPLGRGLTEFVLQTGKTLLANPEVFNLLVEEEEVESIGTASVDWLGVPLKIENKVIGVMGTQTYSEEIRLRKRDEQMISFVSTQVAMAIERKRAEEKLRSSQRRNELLVQASTDGIILEGLDGRILDCNQVAEQMFGYTREELLKLNVTDLIPEEFLRDKENFIHWELEQGGYLNEIPNVRKDGSIIPVEVSLRLTNTEGAQYVVAFLRDITERKKVERAIAESEQKFRTLAETAAAGIFIHRGGNFLYVNPTWCKITGFAEEDLLKMNYLATVVPEEVEAIEQKHNAQINEDLPVSRFEMTINSKQGERKWLDITTGLIDFEGGRASIGTAIDISYRKQREHELEVVAQISEALRMNLTREEVHQTILNEIMHLLDIDGALVSTIENDDGLYLFDRAIGCWKVLDKVTLKVSEGLSGYIVISGKPYVNHHASHDPHFAFPELVQKLTSVAGVPLITKGETIGSILIGSAHVLSDNDIRLLRAIGDLAASAIHRSDLHDETIRQARELKIAYDATLEGWAHALELRDKETQGHSLRIANMTLRLAKRLGYRDTDLENVRRGALLHDIGKMGVPDTILLKPGSLTEEEWKIMQKHPIYAYEMLSELPYFKQALDIPYCHHEWWDGTGYPRGLKDNEIPLVARIFAIVDAWDALISDRPYRKAWVKKEALSHIIDQSGTHFDPEVVNAFVQMLKEEKI